MPLHTCQISNSRTVKGIGARLSGNRSDPNLNVCRLPLRHVIDKTRVNKPGPPTYIIYNPFSKVIKPLTFVVRFISGSYSFRGARFQLVQVNSELKPRLLHLILKESVPGAGRASWRECIGTSRLLMCFIRIQQVIGIRVLMHVSMSIPGESCRDSPG